MAIEGISTLCGRGTPPTLSEYPVAESLHTFYRSGIVNAEADIPVTRQHRLPLFILQSTGGNKQTHRPSGFFGKRPEQLYPLLGNNPEQRVGYQIYLRAELLEHRGSNAENSPPAASCPVQSPELPEPYGSMKDRWQVSTALPDY